MIEHYSGEQLTEVCMNMCRSFKIGTQPLMKLCTRFENLASIESIPNIP